MERSAITSLESAHVLQAGWERIATYVSSKTMELYRIAGKFGGELNLAVWRSILQLPN